jgi:hypothetical protein
MTIEVVPLTEDDIPGAIQVIQRAFEDDPYYKWVFDASTVCNPAPLDINMLNAGGFHINIILLVTRSATDLPLP